MKDVHTTLDVIGQLLKIDGLSFNHDGQAAIDMTADETIFLTTLDDEMLELSCLLDNLGYPDAPMMQALLEANFLGAATGFARLSLDADKSEVIISERWRVTEMDARTVENRFNEFFVLAAFWLTDGTTSLLDQAQEIRAKARPEDVPETGASEDAPVIMRL